MKKKNEKQVAVVKENNDAEVKVNEAPAQPSNVYYLKKEVPESLEKVIEDERQSLYKYYKNLSRRNNIIMFVSVAIFIAAFILLSQGTWGMITGWSLVGATVVGMAVYHILTRNQYPRMSKHYFNTYWTTTNDYLFVDPKYTDCKVDFVEKYQLADVAADRVYKDILDLASRNIVRGKYEGKDFTYGELAFYRQGERKRMREVIFVGRHIQLDNHLAIPEGRFLINLKGEKNLDLPTDIDDLVKLEEDGNMIIYGLEGADYKKFISDELLRRLKNIEVDKALLNVNIVLWSGRTSIYLSYDDAIVAIPFNQPFNAEAYKQLRSNVNEMIEILSEL